jgi:hypothetical protein
MMAGRVAAAKIPTVAPGPTFGNRGRGAPVHGSARTNTYTSPAYEAQYSGTSTGPHRGSYRGATRGATRAPTFNELVRPSRPSYNSEPRGRHHPYAPAQHQLYQNRTATFPKAGPLVRSPHINIFHPDRVGTRSDAHAKQIAEQDSKRNTTLCRDFTSTGIYTGFWEQNHLKPSPSPSEYTNIRVGICTRPECRYMHDQNKVAICKAFLFKDNCADGDDCPLSHTPSPHNTVACSHFRKGNCTKDDCHFAHVHVNSSATVCAAFSRLGYCEKGDTCADRHAFDECPDFTNKGVCKAGAACRLTHVRHAGRLRKARPSADAESPLSLTPENGTMDDKAPTIFSSNKSDALESGTLGTDSNNQSEVSESDMTDTFLSEAGINPGLSQQADFVPFE